LPLEDATNIIAQFLKKNDIVIYESTVFPGCTEEFCVPILERQSKLKYNIDFFCGYSPERINPGDREHSLTKIIKITSGSNQIVADFIDALYSEIITAGTHKVSSIKVAESAKVIGNTQRDVNIALVNELSMIFNKMNIDTKEVLDAASTKWNFLPFNPGLVGGHCIGVDPYYLTYKAKEIGFHPEIILAGRKINDRMGSFLANVTFNEIKKKGISSDKISIAILGLTFKEDCPDLRNTKVIPIIKILEQHDCKVIVSDICADKNESKNNYGINLVDLNEIKEQDVVIVAVGHSQYKKLSKIQLEKMLNPDGIIIDVKSLYDKRMFDDSLITHWRL